MLTIKLLSLLQASNRYAQEATVSAAYGGRVQSPFWAPLVAAPFAYAAFWGSSDNENTLEKANEDIEERTLPRAPQERGPFLHPALRLFLSADD